MGTDRMFSVGISKGIKLHARIAPTYASLFSFFGKYNQGKFLGVPQNELGKSEHKKLLGCKYVINNYDHILSSKGVAHTEDLYYYFSN